MKSQIHRKRKTQSVAFAELFPASLLVTSESDEEKEEEEDKEEDDEDEEEDYEYEEDDDDDDDDEGEEDDDEEEDDEYEEEDDEYEEEEEEEDACPVEQASQSKADNSALNLLTMCTTQKSIVLTVFLQWLGQNDFWQEWRGQTALQ